jgi:predicted glycosyltransferase
MIRFYNHLPTDELEKEITSAEFVIARCGYSTVMDLVTLNKKAVLVPTPGQPEQEYLGKHLHGNGIACCIDQTDFSLENALRNLRSFSFTQPGFLNTNALIQLVSELKAELSVSKKPNQS